MMKCVVCGRMFNDQREAEGGRCKSGGSHMLQEMVRGSINPDDGAQADFVSVDERDLKKWGEEAKKLYGDDYK